MSVNSDSNIDALTDFACDAMIVITHLHGLNGLGILAPAVLGWTAPAPLLLD
jgi:hypothetical protein